MKIFFKDVSGIGTLKIEHVFYEYGEPTLFVCIDAGENRYLCACCRLGEEWLVGQISEDALVRMIDDKVTLDKMFKEEAIALFTLIWDGVRLKISGDIEEDMYPETGALLELSTGENTILYKESLQTVMEEKTSLFAAAQFAATWTAILQKYYLKVEPSESIVPMLKMKEETDFINSEIVGIGAFKEREHLTAFIPVSLKDDAQCAVSLKGSDTAARKANQSPDLKHFLLPIAA